MTNIYHNLATGAFTQNWSDIGLITTSDNWDGVPSIIGYRGDDLITATDVDPQTVVADGTGVVDVNANQTNPNTFTTGGVTEFQITDPVIALQGSGTADAPFVLIHLNTLGVTNVNISYKLRDIDGSADNAVQPVALQYRVGTSGNFINIPAGFVADASTGPNLATLVTTINAILPVAAENQSQVQLRIITTNASGNDEWIGIDDINIFATPSGGSTPTVNLSVSTNAGSEAGTTAITLTATASSAVSDNQTVDLGLSGTGITAGDYTLTNPTITIANGSTTGSVTFTVVDDALAEGTETAILTISNPSAGIALGGTTTQNVIITDNDNLAPTLIHDIQGSGSTAALTGTQTIEGIVTRAFLSSTKLNGFYVQEEDADADGNSATSEAIFVFDPSGLFSGNVGDKVRVTGTVKEFTTTSAGKTSSLTEIDTITSVINLGASTLPTVTNVQLPVTNVSDLERYEGMLVNVSAGSGNLTVTENFQLGRFGQVLLSATGSSNQPGTDARLDQYTQFNAPSVSGYSAYLAEIAKREIYLDDGSGTQNLDPIIFGRGGNPLSASNTLRGGDTVDSITGVLDERFEGYRIQTSTGVNFTPTNPRPVNPPAVGGTLKVSSFNVLNFFNGNGTGGGFPTARGAENLTELNRQRDKIIQAIVTSGVDVVGLEELENDGYGSTSAIQDLVNGLNAVAGAGTYSFINPGTSLATDEITVGLIYKSGKVTPVGAAATLTTSAAFNLVGRQPLAQTFSQNSNSEQFTIVVNHFKSKGSSSGGVGDADAGDGQGLSNGTRTRQAQDLAAWLATKPTGTNDTDYLVVGDLNSYAKEDPLTTLASAGYNNLLSDTSYSYVFDGQVGSLDHALATGSLAAQVSGAEKWHINADEPTVLDYNTNFKSAGQISSLYNADQFRASDHDPVLVGLNLVSANNAPTNVSLSPTSVNENVAANTSVGTFTTTDPDTGNTFTYSLVAGTGATDNAAFAIANNNSLQITASPDFETKSSYSVRVRSTDNGGLSVEKVLTIQVNNVNEAPTLVQPLDDQILTTNKPFSFNVSNKFADVDQGDTLNYIATGLPTGSSIVANTGVVSGTISQIGIFPVTVTATDSQGSNVSDTFDLTVANNKATSGNDIIFIDQLGGVNTVNALAGSDRVIGTNSNETIDGGDDNDTIFGGLGNDTLSGGKDNDRLIGWGGGTSEIDLLNGDQGEDTYVLGNASSVFYASSGNADYANIASFKSKDKIELKGLANNYSLGSALAVSSDKSAVGIFTNNGTELIAVVEKGLKLNTNLATDTSFVFV